MAILSGSASVSGNIRCPGARPVDRHLAVFFGAIIFCMIYAFAATGAGNVVVFIDTFFSAGMLALTLYNIDPERTLKLRRVIQCLLLLNALVALFELEGQSHLVPIPLEASDKENEFRPTGLYDHPLTAATITMLGLWLAPRCQTLCWWCYVLVLIAALLAFGERTPLVVTLIGLIVYQFKRRSRVILSRDIHAGKLARLMAFVLAVCVIAAAAYASAGTRLSRHLYWDNSAQVRLSQFGIINSLDSRELLFGCPRAVLLGLIEPLRLTSRVAVIENFWLFNVVTLGLFCFPVFVIAFASLLKSLWLSYGSRGQLMVALFVAVTSSSNSLGRKSTLLVTLVACVVASATSFTIDHSDNPVRAGGPP